ncbi:Atg14p NDAI_0A08110 [Naumovozyma dairenensis CBS 421]|uniref:Autophagy-related protein 14 n=1 Tax=Naumovozyma dairenensis (strain ATCC 10597 / BCRC 20456 / CBS 421 / NBRC 0211 / NRRL Y-12639) TaxID=1071378 RepID=G0W577_NAUDC|nr:hypothetical protein NDAI_0A08110 [Naumovozyma dairenensis CBS 421]CCD22965.1 hypothetical protein NDAI_0A08110 [Naumovozyma dairenensis CBS 421]
MQCSVCLSERKRLYCGNCMNTSPNLLLKLHLKLILLKQQNARIKDKVNEVLNFATNETSNSHDMKIDGENELQAGLILRDKLKKLQHFKEQKRNNRIKFRIEQMNKRLDDKRTKIAELQVELKNSYSMASTINIDTHIDAALLHERDELKRELTQLEKLVETKRISQINQLTDWFMIKKRSDTHLVPYSISFEPIISMKSFHKIPRMVAIDSIAKMSHYIGILSKLINSKLPFDESIFQSSLLTDYQEESIDIVEKQTKLLINVLETCRQLHLMSSNNEKRNDFYGQLNLNWLLDQYDTDSLFYNMATRQQITIQRPSDSSTPPPPVPVQQHRPPASSCKTVYRHAPKHGQLYNADDSNQWTFTKIYDIVAEMLNLSLYEGDSYTKTRKGKNNKHVENALGTKCNNNHKTGKNESHDRWFVVG